MTGGPGVPPGRDGSPHDGGTGGAGRSSGPIPTAPGRNDTSGPWMYISGLSFIAFLLTTATLVVLGLYLLAIRLRTRRSAADR